MILFKPYNSPLSLSSIYHQSHYYYIRIKHESIYSPIILLTYPRKMHEGPQKPKRRSQEQKQEPPEV